MGRETCGFFGASVFKDKRFSAAGGAFFKTEKFADSGAARRERGKEGLKTDAAKKYFVKFSKNAFLYARVMV